MDFKENSRVSLGPSNIIDEGSKGFILRFNGKLLFDENETTLKNAEEKLFLKRMALILQKMPANIHLDVIGYTDDSQIIPTQKYQDNLGVSAMRALGVARVLIENGVNPQKKTSLGNGATNVVLPNTTEENKAQNRRVEFRFYPNDRYLHKVQNILDKTIEQKNYEQKSNSSISQNIEQ